MRLDPRTPQGKSDTPQEVDVDQVILDFIAEGCIRTFYDPVARDLVLFSPDDSLPLELHPENLN
jgi:hypothetical protein